MLKLLSFIFLLYCFNSLYYSILCSCDILSLCLQAKLIAFSFLRFSNVNLMNFENLQELFKKLLLLFLGHIQIIFLPKYTFFFKCFCTPQHLKLSVAFFFLKSIPEKLYHGEVISNKTHQKTIFI